MIEIKICVFNLPRSDMCVPTRSNWAVFLLLCCIQLLYFLSATWELPQVSAGAHITQHYLWVPPQYLWCACQCLSGHQQGTGRFRMGLVRGWSWGTMRNCLNGYPFAPMDILCLPHRSCPFFVVHFDQSELLGFRKHRFSTTFTTFFESPNSIA